MSTAASSKPKTDRTSRTKGMPPYNVVLLDDDDHTYNYVIEMLNKVFGYSPEKGMKLAKEVDANGRVIVLTTNLEVAELKRDEILAFGPDPMMSRSKGSMSATIEPASGG